MGSPDRLLAASRPVHPALMMVADLGAAALAPLAAHWIRRPDFPDFGAVMSYWAASVLCSSASFLLFSVARSIWRYFTLREVVTLATAVVTAVSSASFLAFSLDRMQAVSRTEPLLHGALLLSAMVLIRIAAQQVERSKRAAGKPLAAGSGRVSQVLVIGTSPLAEIYLRTVDGMASFSTTPVDVVGIVAEKPRHVGLSIRGRAIVGTLADLEAVFTKLSVHGVHLDAVALAVQDRYIPLAARELLQRREADGVQVIRLPTLLGASFADWSDVADAMAVAVPLHELGTWRGKRTMDVLVSAALLAVLSPVLLLVGLCLLADVGRPVIFWQIRPGFRGVATRFYKLRTMRDVKNGIIRADDERISAFGRLLRRTRLDEVPQLINILIGQMSIIGPRPLLLRDLHEDGADRIRMRPGITGWAQVNGGKLISPKDKMALDLWYAHHASPMLDLMILWRTVLTVLRGDLIRQDAIDEARAFSAHRPKAGMSDVFAAGSAARPTPRRAETSPIGSAVLSRKRVCR